MVFVFQDRRAQEHAVQTPWRSHLGFGATSLSASISNKDADTTHSLLKSSNFSWLSPTSTVSTVSPAAGLNDIWDAPETPCGKSGTGSRGISTPLTPPTPLESSRKLVFTPISKFSFGTGVSPVAKQQTLETKDVALQDDQFRPMKIFRNLTSELQEISQKNVASLSVKYDINPSFEFSDDPISTRTRSKTSSKTLVASAVHVALNGGSSDVETPHYRTTPFVRSAFGKLLEQIMPHDLHARIASEPTCCVASLVTDSSRRCAKSKRSFCDIGDILKKLARCKSANNYFGMLNNIEDLVDSVMCNIHWGTVLKQLKAGSRMAQLRSRVEDMTSMTEVNRAAFNRWVSAICDLEAPGDRASEPLLISKHAKQVVKTKPIVKLQIKAPAHKAVVRFALSSGFSHYEPQKTRGYPVFDALYEQAASPLTPRARDPGFIYIYWDRAFFGKIKIGFTNNLTERLKTWRRKCNPENAYHSGTESQVEMPHVFRVEQLIHTELKEYRLRRQCDGCGKLHKEWFEVNQVHAVKVMKKWRDWMLQEPYVYDEMLFQWVIKPEMLDTLGGMCEPIPHELGVQNPRRNSMGLHRTPQKKKGSRRTM